MPNFVLSDEQRAMRNRYTVMLADRREGKAVMRDVSDWPMHCFLDIAGFVDYLETRHPTQRVVVIDWGEASRKEDV